MRSGYGGRGVTCLSIGGISLWAIWSGGSAQGTSSVLERLSGSTWRMVVTGLIHGALGVTAALIALDDRSGGNGGRGIDSAVATVLGWPGGRWILGFGALCTIGAAIHYFAKVYKASTARS